MQEVFHRPPIPYEPEKHSLKAWAKYCLQERGYKIVYADKADFAIESKIEGKVYFKVTDQADSLDSRTGWIVCDRTTKVVTIIPPATKDAE